MIKYLNILYSEARILCYRVLNYKNVHMSALNVNRANIDHEINVS